jgi:hypothetical protein
MDRNQVLNLVNELFDALDATTLEPSEVIDGLRCLRRVQSCLDVCDGALRQRLEVVSRSVTDAADDAREASRCSRSLSRRRDRRSRIMRTFPATVVALAEGLITAEHVDSLSQAWFALEPDRRDELASRGEELVTLASTMSPESFRIELHHVIDQLRTNAGESRSDRQRRAAYLRTWTDRSTGMLRLSGAFDPTLARELTARLDHALSARHARQVPEGCPTDPIAKNDWLRAHALMDLVGEGPVTMRTEIMVVVDGDQIRTNSGEVSLEDLRKLAATGAARWSTVIVGDDGVIDAPGRLELGRRSRLPNDAQRRALFVLYPTCSIPGCPVEFRLCTIHHVRWWRDGGTTDLGNLVPLCDDHHRAVHHEGWTLVLGPRRRLTVVRSDGRRLVGTPHRHPSHPPDPHPPDRDERESGSLDSTAKRHTVSHDTSRRTVDDAHLLGPLDGEGVERALPHEFG